MNDSTLIVVHGYAGDADRVRMLMPWFLHHERPVLVLSPEDSPIKDLGVAGDIRYHSVGHRAYIGHLSLNRQYEHLKYLLLQPFDFFLANDSDSFCVLPQIPHYLYADPGTIWSNEVVEPRPHESPLPKIAMQPPYFFHRSVLEKLINAAPGIVMHPITPYVDHWMLQVSHKAGVTHKCFLKGPDDQNIMPHPVKKIEQIEQLTQSYREGLHE